MTSGVYPRKPSGSLPPRGVPFHSQIEVKTCGCWLWLGTQKETGYGRYYRAPVGSWQAHRYSYVAYYGEIDNDLEIDHLCRNRACVNPLHLEAVTHEVNMFRARQEEVKKYADSN